MARRLSILASLALGLISSTAIAAESLGTAKVSNLPWYSGASDEPAFGTWRGSALDVRVVFIQHDTWDQMRQKLQGADFKGNCPQTPLCVVSLAMFPKNLAGQFNQCAGGSFDVIHRELGNLIKAVRSNAIVRLGWEANGTSSHPWTIGTTANIDPYKRCFRRLAQIHRGLGLRIEWSVSKGGNLDAYSTYPGNDVVDFWGLHYYHSGTSGTPRQERGAWLAKAQQNGKLLNFPEWGLWKYGDNTAYIQGMYDFFKANAAKIGYENYYNKNSDHMLYPTTKFPNGAALYRRLW